MRTLTLAAPGEFCCHRRPCRFLCHSLPEPRAADDHRQADLSGQRWQAGGEHHVDHGGGSGERRGTATTSTPTGWVSAHHLSARPRRLGGAHDHQSAGRLVRPAQPVLLARPRDHQQRDDREREGDDVRSIPSIPGHTFTIPDLGVNVPLEGVADDAPAGATNVVSSTSSCRTSQRTISGGSASSPAPPGRSTATAGPCRRSATWPASCRWADDEKQSDRHPCAHRTWVILAVAGDIGLGLAPIPPGLASNLASDESAVIRILHGCLADLLRVLAGLFFTLVFNKSDHPSARPPRRSFAATAGSRRPGSLTTVVLVLILATYGTVELGVEEPGGGISTVSTALPPPASADQPLEVQVIAQQWWFTYRYPTYGGIETAQLVLPVGRRSSST